MHEGLIERLVGLAVASRIYGENGSIPLLTLLDRSRCIADFTDGQLTELAYVVNQKSSVPIHLTVPSANGKFNYRYCFEKNGVRVTTIGTKKNYNSRNENNKPI